MLFLLSDLLNANTIIMMFIPAGFTLFLCLTFIINLKQLQYENT